MSQRITVMLEDSHVEKLRTIQAKDIKKTNKSISFSKVLNAAVAKGLK